MNIIIGQNESLPNISGTAKWYIMGAPDSSSSELKGCFSKQQNLANVQTLSYNNAIFPDRVGVKFDASRTLNMNGSDDPTKWTTTDNHTYKDNAEVKTKNFTYRIWFRIF